MNNHIHGNRRQMYRCEPPPVAAPTLAVYRGDKGSTADFVIDVTLSGVRAALPAAGSPVLAEGDAVIVAIQAAGLDGQVEIGARVVFACDEGAQRIVALAFSDKPDLSNRTTAEFFSVFNRRENLREAPREALSVEALVLDANGQPDGVIDVAVVNQSATGMGIAVDASTDAYIRDAQAVALALPGNGAPARPLSLRHRVNRDDGVYYGASLA